MTDITAQQAHSQPYEPTLDLTTIRAAVFDLDGVVWRGDEILPGVPDLFYYLRDQGIPYMLVTNNSTRTVEQYVEKIGALNIPIDADHILTSGLVTAEMLTANYPPGTPIYVIGTDSLIGLMTSRGFVFDPARAQVVVVGLDVNLTYHKLKIAGQRVLAGAEFIGTNADRTFPMPGGELIPGAGSLLAAVEAMVGRPARVMGKPAAIMFQTALAHLGTPAAETLMIGDRLDTDILGAQLVGMPGALVLTGISGREDIGNVRPEGVYADLMDLLAAWQQARGR